jgi:hypothetical protein
MPFLDARTSRHYPAENLLGFAARRGLKNPRRVEFTAEADEKIEDVSVRRSVTELAPVASFVVSPHLRRATVTPPAPFSGTATFERHGKSMPPSWTGSLSVSFPGRPNLPLTGPRFRFVTLGQSRY